MFYSIYRKVRRKILKIFRKSSSGKKVVSAKSRIREEVKRLKFLIPPEEKLRQTEAVFARIEAMPEFQKASAVLMY
jgi:hypothetical protein